MIQLHGEMAEGLYELLATEALGFRLRLRPQYVVSYDDINDEDVPDFLSRYVTDAVRQSLVEAKPADRVALTNRLLQELNAPGRV